MKWILFAYILTGSNSFDLRTVEFGSETACQAASARMELPEIFEPEKKNHVKESLGKMLSASQTFCVRYK